jgi:hypothetical protein
VDPKRNPRGGPDPLRPPGSPPAPSTPGVPPTRPGEPAAGAPPASGRRQPPGAVEAMDQLSRDVSQLRVDFERFFNGALPFPPEELRNRVQSEIRKLRGMNLLTFADNFRLGDLEARFNSYNELFTRRLRDLEEGRRQVSRPVPMPAERRFDPEKGVVLGDRIEPEAVEALYQGLAGAPGGAGPRFDLDSFQTYVTRQVAAIREKTGCSQVQFRVAAEDGKLKLKARPVATREGT